MIKKITFIALLLFSTAYLAQTTTYINEDFETVDASGGTQIIARDITKFNYTAFIAAGGVGGTFDGDNGNATPAQKTNAVAINNSSATPRWSIAIAGGQNAFRINGGGNYSNEGAGIYFTGLDLTGQKVLNFSFQIRGANPDNDLDLPATYTDWTINLNHGNSNTDFDLSDSYFEAGDNVTQNIPFTVNNLATATTLEDQTSFDIISAEWVTISGSIDLTDKNLGTFAALQIQTDTGGFISNGKAIFLLDNVAISADATLSSDSFALENQVKVYPNPASTNLTISNLDKISIKNVTLINLLGKEVLKSQNTENLNVSQLSRGIYILKIESTSNKIINKKVILK